MMPSVTFTAPTPPVSPFSQTDYVFLVDTSSSMLTPDMHGGAKTRWDALQETTFGVTTYISQFDPDGIDIIPFAGRFKWFRNAGPEKVLQIFKECTPPMGSTALDAPLQSVFDEYFAKRDAGKLKQNGTMVIVITDGEPDNQESVMKVLITAANKLYPKDKLSVNFVQVGYDRNATNFLNALDTQLVPRGAVRDIVSTIKLKEIEDKGLQQVLLDTMNGGARATA